MSYNVYDISNSYSPYYQPRTEQDTRAQYTDSSRGGPYQSQTYQPLSAYQSAQHLPQSSAPQSASTSACVSHGYRDMNGAGSSRSQDSPANSVSDGRQTDTSALGNLAYASTLGRKSQAPQQNADFTRHQKYGGTASFTMNSVMPAPYGTYGADHQRTESRDSGITSRENSGGRPQVTTSTAGIGYNPARSDSPYQRPQTNTAGNWQAQAQYIAAQSPSSEHTRLHHSSNQSPRPSSSQAKDTKFSSHDVPPPTVPAVQPAQRDIGNNKGIGTVRSTGQQVNRTAGTPTGLRPEQAKTTTPSQQGIGRSSAHSSPETTAFPRNKGADNLKTSVSQASTPTTNYPTTVDPSQVFNHVEYQRRQAAAAAEQEAARNRSAEAARAANPLNIPQPRKGKENTKDTINSTTIRSAPEYGAPADMGSDPDTIKKNQMKLEMKQMIEKMRDYKSKDPSLFSEIWEQVKKGHPPQRNPSVSATQGSPSPITTNPQASTYPANVHLPPESELPAATHEDSFPPNFDRGRYPAQRRRRGGKDFTPPRKDKKSHHKKIPVPPSTSSPIPNGYVAAGSSPNPGTPAMQQAMANFHNNSHPPTLSANPQPPPKAALSTSARVAKSSPIPTANQQSQSITPKAGGTYWPENRKRALAEAAQTALTSSEANKGKQINTDEIHELLNQNPSYSEMCEILEYRGFVIDRSQFARILLKSVPDLNSSSAPSSSAVPPTPPPMPLSANVARPLQYYNPHHDTNAKITPNAHPSASVHPQIISPAPGQEQSLINPSVAMKPPASSSVATPGVSLPGQTSKATQDTKEGLHLSHEAPSTKEQQAKKRNFSDIVDLTTLSDDEDDEPPSQQPRLEDNSVAPDNATSENIAHNDLNANAAVSPTVGIPSFDDNKSNPSNTKLLQRQDIVRALNKRQDALRRSKYSARTIAQDILIGMGRHTRMRALNGHLDPIREKFQAVDYNSDLSTLRWDLIDPGGPKSPQLRSGNDEQKAHTPDTLRVSVIVNAGTATDGNPHKSTSKHQSRKADHNFDRFVHNYIPSMQTPFAGASTDTPSHVNGTPATSGNMQTPTPGTTDRPRRIGRPPGAKNKQPRPDKGIPKKFKETPTRNIETRSPPSNRPHINTTPVKSSNLKNAMSPRSSAKLAVVIPSRSPSIAGSPSIDPHIGSQPARRGRPKKDPMIGSEGHPLSPEFKIFKCQWEECPAELHNLETLRKHVGKHRRMYSKGPYPCRWANCTRSKDSSSNGGNLVLKTDVEWDEHMAEKHVGAAAWESGDGAIDAKDELRSVQPHPMINSSRAPSQSSASTAFKDIADHPLDLSATGDTHDSPTQVAFRVLLPPLPT